MSVLAPPSIPGVPAGRRIAGLDEWRGVLVLAVALAHFVVFRLHDHSFHHPYEPLQPLARQGGTAPAAAGLLPAASGAGEGPVQVQGFALDPTATRDSGVAEVKVAFGEGPPRPARTGLPTPGMAAVRPQFAGSGWAADLEDAGLEPGQAVPVRVLVRRTDGAEVTFAGSVRYRGRGSSLARVRWVPVVAQAAVDHFFVISGFLITLILVRTKGRPGYLRIFWTRRALRILPLAWLLTAVAWFAHPACRPMIPAYVFFYANYQEGTVPMLAPMWSLMVEEQFYLVFPVLCWLVPRRWLWAAVGAACLALAASRLHFPAGYVDGVYIGTPWTHLRAIALALGCWMALLREGLVPRPRLCAAVFVAWVVLWAAFGGPEPLFAPMGRLGLLDPVSLAGAVLLLAWLTARPRSGPSWLRYLGVRCYGIYLLHAPLLHLFRVAAPDLPLGWSFVLWLAAVVGLTEVSYRCLEAPALGLAPGYPAGPARDTANSGAPCTSS